MTPFAFAGIWDQWTNHETGEIIPTFSIITTKANKLLGAIHNTRQRMPVILPLKQEKNWLKINIACTKLKSLLSPFPDSALEAFPVNLNLNDSVTIRNNPRSHQIYKYPVFSSSQPSLEDYYT